MRCCFSRLNTCCAHKEHWMCGYVKQVNWFITLICHLHWMVLITARTNSSFITSSNTTGAVLYFYCCHFSQLFSEDANCQLTGQSPQVTWFILTHWLKIQSSKKRTIIFSSKTGKVFWAVCSPSKEHCISSATIRISSASLVMFRCEKYLFPWFCQWNPYIAFARAAQIFLSRCLCHKRRIGVFSLCELKSSTFGFMCWFKKLLEAELQTGPCFVPRCFQFSFFLLILAAASENSQMILLIVCLPPAWPTSELAKSWWWLQQNKSLSCEKVFWKSSPHQAFTFALWQLQTGPGAKKKVVWTRKFILCPTGL